MSWQRSVFALILSASFVPAAAAQPLVVASYNFTDGGLDGWAPYGSATLAITTPPVPDANGDSNALLVSGRSDPGSGPGINLAGTLTAGATYQLTAYVLLASTDLSSTTATMSFNLGCATGASSNADVATAALSTSGWVKLQGNFSFSGTPNPPAALTLFIQSNSATASFYVDAVTITQLASPPSPATQDNSGVSTDFEDGGVDGWTGRSGSSTVANSTAAAHSGSSSLLVTGRVGAWDGPQFNVNGKMFYGSQYAISAWVRLQQADGQPHTINLSMQLSLGGVVSYPWVTQITIAGDGNWHQISAPNYAVPQAFDDGTGTASVYLQTGSGDKTPLASFYVDDVSIAYIPQPVVQTAIPSIYQTLSPYFPVGAAISLSDLSGPHSQLLTQHFSSIVPGNDMKWSSVEPSLGVYTYGNADAVVSFAACNGLRVRGHNLVWATGTQTPAYAFGDGTNSTANQAVVTANIREHIQSEVTHVGNAVYVWDVVNEPIDATQPDCLAHGPFYEVLGKSYIDIALTTARQYAPPGVELVINEWGTADPARLACLIGLVQDLRNRGIPIDGIGHETHNAIDSPSTAAMVSAVNQIASAFPGIDQQITELDESVYRSGQLYPASNCVASDFNVTNGGVIPASIIAEQGWLYAQSFAAFEQLAGKISAVTIWGFSDDESWLNTFPCAHLEAPLPFDVNLQAKPAFWGIVDPTQLPGYGLAFAVSNQADGAGSAAGKRVWTITASNPSGGFAYSTFLNGFTLAQTSGSGACLPVVTAPGAYPISLGDIAAGGSASISFTIDFSKCDPAAQFSVTAPWSSAVYNTGTLSAGGLSK